MCAHGAAKVAHGGRRIPMVWDASPSCALMGRPRSPFRVVESQWCGARRPHVRSWGDPIVGLSSCRVVDMSTLGDSQLANPNGVERANVRLHEARRRTVEISRSWYFRKSASLNVKMWGFGISNCGLVVFSSRRHVDFGYPGLVNPNGVERADV
eukprot:gene12861-biopygen1817